MIFTGQHPGLDPVDHGLDGFAAADLGCPGCEDPRAHALAVARRLAPLLAARPDLLIVQGDTSSAMGGALAAEGAAVPLAHVEAGLRTHDPRLPWPEEEVRVAIDARAALLFAPTALSAANLRAEGVAGVVQVTGNSGIDALLAVARRLPPGVRRDKPHLLVTCHRRESWGEGLAGIAAAIAELTCDGEVTADVLLHPNAHVSAAIEGLLGGAFGVRLLPPCGHRALLQAMREATLVLSDSGGIQEEAPALGVPLLVLRDKTERPEALASGNMILVGTDRTRIVAGVRRLLANPAALGAMGRVSFPYGDGKSGPRIAAIVADWLAARTAGERRLA